MLDIILPIGGSLLFPAPNDDIPVLLKNVAGKPVIYWAMQHLERIEGPKRYFLIGERQTLETYNIRNVLKFYTDEDVQVRALDAPTQGALCSVLLSIDQIDPSAEVLVAALDQFLDYDLTSDIARYRKDGHAAGVWSFDSVHPKWSYARLDGDRVIEVREKNPISTHALTSLYWFARAETMYNAMMDNIRRGNTVNGQFYLAPCLNELILRSKSVCATMMDNTLYHNFYDMQQITSFKPPMANRDPLIEASRAYAAAFDECDIDAVSSMMDPQVSLMDSFTPTINGRDAVVKFVSGLFDNSGSLTFQANRISKLDGTTTAIEFKLTIDGKQFDGVDFIEWREGRISSLKAFLHERHMAD